MGPGQFTHIHPGYYTSMPQYHWSNMEESGVIYHMNPLWIMILPKVSYGMSIVRIWEKIYLIIMVYHTATIQYVVWIALYAKACDLDGILHQQYVQMS